MLVLSLLSKGYSDRIKLCQGISTPLPSWTLDQAHPSHHVSQIFVKKKIVHDIVHFCFLLLLLLLLLLLFLI